MSRARIALGTAQLGLPYGIANGRGLMSEAEAEAVLAAAVELGVSTWDTAPAYGLAEARIGRFVRARGRPAGLQLCSKLPALPDGIDRDDVAAFVHAHIDASRRALATDRIDVYLVHAAADVRRAGPVLLDALVDARAAGRVGQLGVSIYERAELDLCLDDARLAAVQLPFNVFDQRCNVAPLRAADKRVFARSILLQGLLSLAHDAPAVAGMHGAVARWLRRFHALCAPAGVAPVTAALQFAARRGPAHELVVGVLDPAQLRHAVAVIDGPSPGDDALLAAFEAQFAAVPPAVMDPRRWEAAS